MNYSGHNLFTSLKEMLRITDERVNTLTYAGLVYLTVGVIIAVLSAFTDGSVGAAWPSSISATLTDFNTPQARFFLAMMVLAVICFMIKGSLCLPPYSSLEQTRHLCFCTGLIIIGVVNTSVKQFADFTSADTWFFTLHMIGGALAFAIHPIIELCSLLECFRYTLNQIDVDEQGRMNSLTVVRARTALAVTSLGLAIIFVILNVALGMSSNPQLPGACFSIECLMAASLIADAWLIVTVTVRT